MIQYEDRAKAPGAEKIEGTVLIVGANGVVTLEGGIKLTVPKTVPTDELKAGATIVAEYERKGRRKFATSIQIKDGSALGEGPGT